MLAFSSRAHNQPHTAHRLTWVPRSPTQTSSSPHRPQAAPHPSTSPGSAGIMQHFKSVEACFWAPSNQVMVKKILCASKAPGFHICTPAVQPQLQHQWCPPYRSKHCRTTSQWWGWTAAMLPPAHSKGSFSIPATHRDTQLGVGGWELTLQILNAPTMRSIASSRAAWPHLKARDTPADMTLLKYRTLFRNCLK